MKTATKNQSEIKLTGKYDNAIGRRKRAIAEVRLYPGKGKIVVNGVIVDPKKATFLKPLKDIGKLNTFDISAKVTGGGITGQAEAIRHGISRALLKYDSELRHTLKKAGYLTRDPREKERKKPGLKRARKAPQWQKR